MKENYIPIRFFTKSKPLKELKVNNKKVTCKIAIALYGDNIPKKEEEAILENIPDKRKNYFITTDITYEDGTGIIDFKVTNVNFHSIKTKYDYNELFLIDDGYLPKQGIPLFFIENNIYMPMLMNIKDSYMYLPPEQIQMRLERSLKTYNL